MNFENLINEMKLLIEYMENDPITKNETYVANIFVKPKLKCLDAMDDFNKLKLMVEKITENTKKQRRKKNAEIKTI